MIRFVSEAADLFQVNEVGGAIALLRAALLTENRADIHRYLSLAYAQKRDYERALAEISEAITLDPHSPENYHVRSLLWRLKGDYVEAAFDYHRCTEIDPNYRNVEAIRRGAEAMKSRLTDFRILHWCRSVTPRDPSLRDMVGEVMGEAEKRRSFFDRPSCSVPCPAYCCYFEYDMFDHKVIIEEDQLAAVRGFLAERGFRERDYIGKSRRKVSHKGVRDYVFHPKRSRRLVDRDLLPSVPRNLGYNRIIWASEKARGCMFLTQEGCLIHGVGERPGLDACRSFMCLTGFVFLTLRYLGLYHDGMVEGRAMVELNDLAVKTLLVLCDRFYGDKELTDLESSFHASLVKAVESEKRGDPRELSKEVKECLRHRTAMRKRRKGAMKDLQRDLKDIFRNRSSAFRVPT